MSDIALESQGMKFYVGDAGSPPNLTEVPEVRGIRGPDGQAGWMDTTDLASVAREGRPQLKDNGTIRIPIFYVPDNAVHAALKSAFDNRTKKRFGIDFTDTAPITKWEFDGYVIGFAINAEVDQPLTADVVVRITDAITAVQ